MLTTLDEMVLRAESLVPHLRERAARTEADRRVPPETIAEFLDAGLFRVFQPERFGGFQLDYGRTQTELCNVLGRGCGSSAWVQCVVACHAWCLGMFPAEAQDAVWRPDPNTLVGTAFNFNSGHGRPVEGGYFLEGDWSFSSGSDACAWIMLGTPIYVDTEQPPIKRLWALLPRRDWEVVDVWFAAGLRGSASNDIHVKGAFVPHAFTVEPETFDGRLTPGSSVNDAYIYRLPLFPVFPYNVSTPALGIARGALESFIASTAARPERANQAQRQLHIAESAAEIDAAHGLWLASAAIIERYGPTGQWPSSALTRVRRDVAFATSLCVRAVDRLTLLLGAHGMAEDNPIQRAWRDVHAVANHAGNNWDVHAITWARDALGLPPAAFR